MMRVPPHAATTVALRGLLVLLVAVVGLLCLSGRTAQQPSVSADQVSVSQPVPAAAPDAAGDSEPCGKKLVVAESGAQHAGVVAPPAEVPVSLRTADRTCPSPSAFTASPVRGPAPPPPVDAPSVLRM
ncbi:hypothetical protein GCM10010297_67860 [Streptomyces malachitofuscus]|nr:hypothetical protein GCM10010297_67860 [Streptomyces malachitofuscus]